MEGVAWSGFVRVVWWGVGGVGNFYRAERNVSRWWDAGGAGGGVVGGGGLFASVCVDGFVESLGGRVECDGCIWGDDWC